MTWPELVVSAISVSSAGHDNLLVGADDRTTVGEWPVKTPVHQCCWQRIVGSLRPPPLTPPLPTAIAPLARTRPPPWPIVRRHMVPPPYRQAGLAGGKTTNIVGTSIGYFRQEARWRTEYSRYSKWLLAAVRVRLLWFLARKAVINRTNRTYVFCGFWFARWIRLILRCGRLYPRFLEACSSPVKAGTA